MLAPGSGVGWEQRVGRGTEGWRVRRGGGGKFARKREGGGGGGGGADRRRRGSGTRDFTTARPTNTVTNTVLSSNDAMGTKAGSPASPEPTFWQDCSTVFLVTRPSLVSGVVGPSTVSALTTNKLLLHRNLNPKPTQQHKCAFFLVLCCCSSIRTQRKNMLTRTQYVRARPLSLSLSLRLSGLYHA